MNFVNFSNNRVVRPFGATGKVVTKQAPATKVCPNGSIVPYLSVCPAPVVLQTCWNGNKIPVTDRCPPSPTPVPPKTMDLLTCPDGFVSNARAGCTGNHAYIPDGKPCGGWNRYSCKPTSECYYKDPSKAQIDGAGVCRKKGSAPVQVMGLYYTNSLSKYLM